MLITISVLACFPQSVSADIFWRPWSFNTFTANRDALAAALMKHLLRESHVRHRPHPESFVRGLRTLLILWWEKELCFWVTPAGRSAWGTPHRPDRPPLIWIHQFRTWPGVCTRGGQQMKGWFQTEPLRGHTCSHSLRSSKSVGRSCLQRANCSEGLASDQGWRLHSLIGLGKFPGKDDSQGLRSLLCPPEWAFFKGKWFLEDLQVPKASQTTNSLTCCASPPHSGKSLP